MVNIRDFQKHLTISKLLNSGVCSPETGLVKALFVFLLVIAVCVWIHWTICALTAHHNRLLYLTGQCSSVSYAKGEISPTCAICGVIYILIICLAWLWKSDSYFMDLFSVMLIHHQNYISPWFASPPFVSKTMPFYTSLASLQPNEMVLSVCAQEERDQLLNILLIGKLKLSWQHIFFIKQQNFFLR